MSVSLIVNGIDFTDDAGGLSWSSVDPGGFESCTFTLPTALAALAPAGAPVVIYEGMTRAWMGRVEEPGDEFADRAAPTQVTAVGAGAVLKDKLLSMVWVDRDLSRWQGPSVQRQINLVGASFTGAAPSVMPDASTGNPSLQTATDGGWTATSRPEVEAWYDAGPGNLLGELRADWARNSVLVATDANWTWKALLSTDDIATTIDATSNLRSVGPGTADITTAGARRFALLLLQYATGPAGADNVQNTIYWSNVRVFGNHGLTIRGSTSATEGIAGSDIATYIAGLAGLDVGVIEDSSSSLIVPHAAYYAPVTYEQHVDDMARLLGWHWGVWEPLNSFDTTPRLDFRSPPQSATAIVNRSDCADIQLAQRLSDFHDTAIVTYADAAGKSGQTTISLANPRLPSGLSRDLALDAGTSTATIAAALGLDALELELLQARGTGSVQLPATVRAAAGPSPSHLVRPGIDRLKITGMPNDGPWTEIDTRRFDTFRISRVTSSRIPGGAIRTTVELDSGANLLDVLLARLQLATVATGT